MDFTDFSNYPRFPLLSQENPFNPLNPLLLKTSQYPMQLVVPRAVSTADRTLIVVWRMNLRICFFPSKGDGIYGSSGCQFAVVRIRFGGRPDNPLRGIGIISTTATRYSDRSQEISEQPVSASLCLYSHIQIIRAGTNAEILGIGLPLFVSPADF